jgi:hypothetical protein
VTSARRFIAYLVGYMRPDQAGGVELVGLDLFSEPDPGIPGAGVTFLVTEQHSYESYGHARDALLKRIQTDTPWLMRIVNVR